MERHYHDKKKRLVAKISVSEDAIKLSHYSEDGELLSIAGASSVAMADYQATQMVKQRNSSMKQLRKEIIEKHGKQLEKDEILL